MTLSLKIKGANYMLVKCKKSFRHQLKEGNIYLVVEIIIKRKSNTIRYRLIDNEGYPAIYEADMFEVQTNVLKDYAITINQESILISPIQIANSELNREDINGFWGLFVEDNLEAKKILMESVENLALSENIITPCLE